MKFQYSVIGDNTQENREWLEILGYKQVHSMYGSFLYTSLTLNEWSFMATSDRHIFPNSFIDCRGNSPLFKAISAMREDSDYMQWFVSYDYGEDWQLSFQEKWDCTNTDWHKATLTELQERFKLK